MNRRSGRSDSVERRANMRPSSHSSPRRLTGTPTAGGVVGRSCWISRAGAVASEGGCCRRRGRTESARAAGASAATAASTRNIIGTPATATMPEAAALPAVPPSMTEAQNLPDQVPRSDSEVHAVSSAPCDTHISPPPIPRRALLPSWAVRRLTTEHAAMKGAYAAEPILRPIVSARSASCSAAPRRARMTVGAMRLEAA
jgi:hypothetical protein